MVASTPAGCWASSGGGGGGTPQCTAGTTAPFGCPYGQTCNVFGSVAVCSACGGEGATTGAGTCSYHLP